MCCILCEDARILCFDALIWYIIGYSLSGHLSPIGHLLHPAIDQFNTIVSYPMVSIP
jgi:hypothetical protein